MNHKIVSITQVYNELEKDNLVRFFKYLKPLVDEIVIYDDCSTDGSFEYSLEQTKHVIRGVKNDFSNEIEHRNILIQKALELKPDFILWVDADEVVSISSKENLIELCDEMQKEKIDGISFKEINFWRSNTWYRTDSKFGDGWFVRLWNVKGRELSLNDNKKGLHQQLYPKQVQKIIKTEKHFFLHYGFSSFKNISFKYFIYKSLGQKGYDDLERFIDENTLQLKKLDSSFFPTGLYEEEIQPLKINKVDFLKEINKFKEIVFKPKYSIICLIYKSCDWLDFIYNQVLKYTDLKDKEFYFIANEPDEEVLNYLKKSKIKYYLFSHNETQKSQWYINNIYAAYNFGAQQAKGDFLIFINSDDALAPNWLENLIKNYNGNNVLTSRLIESGKLRTGKHGIIKNFGNNLSDYKEDEFQKFNKEISEDKLVEGGLYMPMFVRKDHFFQVNQFPEGNLKNDNNLYDTNYTLKGEVSIPGDRIFIKRLSEIGIKHQTSLDSNIYHFQNGEMDDKNLDTKKVNIFNIAICNDICTGINNEKVIWDYLNDNFENSYKIDYSLVGENGFSIKAKEFIDKSDKKFELIIQNATFIKRIHKGIYTIMFLQDDYRQMNRSNIIQEKNLKSAQKLVTNSYQTALSYPEYEFEIIPIGVNSRLFDESKNKLSLRTKFGFNENDKIGIFVGSLSEVKGWSKIKECIKTYKNIKWIVVSKYSEELEEKNVHFYNKISQEVLSELYNCADFFIIGSKVETQCLAALEANFCNIPVIMPRVGIYKDIETSNLEKLGLFNEDLKSSVNKFLNENLTFEPRKTILKLNLDIKSSMLAWSKLIEVCIEENRVMKINQFKFDNSRNIDIAYRELMYRIIGKKLFWSLSNFFSKKNLKFKLKQFLLFIGIFSYIKKIYRRFF